MIVQKYTFIPNKWNNFVKIFSMPHKSGFVNIIGNPNVGKSTLMNALVGEKLSIITSKAQTTRHRIMGIINGDDFQIVYSDTPGILKPAYALQKAMMGFVLSALQDADVLLFVAEAGEKSVDEAVADIIIKSDIPVIAIVNKTDIANEEAIKETEEMLKLTFPKSRVIQTSALLKTNVEQLFDIIVEHLPEMPPYYPKDQLTDKPERFFVSEILREKILLNYYREIPYCAEVTVESYKEEEEITRISVYINISKESHKGIILGHKGSALKKTATEARMDIEAFLGKHVFLEVRVKVRKNWRDDERFLKNFGYIVQ